MVEALRMELYLEIVCCVSQGNIKLLKIIIATIAAMMLSLRFTACPHDFFNEESLRKTK